MIGPAPNSRELSSIGAGSALRFEIFALTPCANDRAWRRRQKSGVRRQKGDSSAFAQGYGGQAMLNAGCLILEKSFTAEDADFAEKRAKSTDFEGKREF